MKPESTQPESAEPKSVRPHRWFAAFYDSLLRRSGDRLTLLRRESAGRAAGRVLEIGCGTGLNADFYSWPEVESLDACEPDPFMARRAQKRLNALPEASRSKTQLHLVPAEALPFADASFDTIVSTLVLCTVSDLPASVRELRRVLKPGGSLYLAEHVAASGLSGGIQQAIQPIWGWAAAGCHLHRDPVTALTDAGFDVVIDSRQQLSSLMPVIIATARR